MALMTRKSLIAISLLGGGALTLAGGFIWFGLYNIAADDTHTRPVYTVLETLRERSIAVRANELQVPDLSDPARIRQGAGNYNAMCTGCHLAPGMAATEMSMGLYPSPPDLTRITVDAAEAFWVIKHGIKASGMPAWGKSMQDEYIWNIAAFVQTLPKLDQAQYNALVASSGGHSHGGGETMPNDHAMPGMTDENHHDEQPAHHDDAGSAPHAHGATTEHHDDAKSAPQVKSTAAGHHDDAGSAPHQHGDATPGKIEASDHTGHDHQH